MIKIKEQININLKNSWKIRDNGRRKERVMM